MGSDAVRVRDCLRLRGCSLNTGEMESQGSLRAHWDNSLPTTHPKAFALYLEPLAGVQEEVSAVWAK